MHIAKAIVGGGLFLLLVGCQNSNTPPANGSQAQNQPPTSPFANASAVPPVANTSPETEKKPTLAQALAEAPKLDPSLKPLAQQYAKVEADLKSHPNDPAVKQAFVNVAYTYAHSIEYGSDKLEPMVKYRASLLLYRKALAVDPNHAPSLHEKDLIESIYRTMPGGIPQD